MRLYLLLVHFLVTFFWGALTSAEVLTAILDSSEKKFPIGSVEIFNSTVDQIHADLQKSKTDLLFPSRNGVILHHSNFTPCAVLLLHGLYQSPQDEKTLSNYFFHRGCNVYAPLLKGHWDKDSNVFHKMSPQDWELQVLRCFQQVQNLGENIFIVGHSTGGLLAWQLAHHVSENQRSFNAIAGLILFAPALELRPRVKLMAHLGGLLRLGRFNTSGMDSEYDQYYKPAQAGVLVSQTIAQIRSRDFSNFQAPRMMIFTTELDDTISIRPIEKIKKQFQTQVQWTHYPFEAQIFHDSIQRGELDVPEGAPTQWIHPNFNSILEQITLWMGNLSE
jgi:esterase/lipase